MGERPSARDRRRAQRGGVPMQRLGLMSVAMMLAACGGSLASEMRDALPSKESARIATPQSGSGQTVAPVVRGDHGERSAVGQHSPYYQLTYDLAVAVNGG